MLLQQLLGVLLLSASATGSSASLQGVYEYFTNPANPYDSQCIGNRRWNQLHIGAGDTATYTFPGPAQYIAFQCVRGNIWDLYSGNPQVTITLNTSDSRTGFDLTELLTTQKSEMNSSAGIQMHSVFSSTHPEAWTLYLQNHNFLWNADIDLEMLVSLDNDYDLDETYVNKYNDLHSTAPPQKEQLKESKTVTKPKDPETTQVTVPPANLTSNACQSGCTPKGGIGVEACSWYLSDEATTWLPPAYATAAHCACQLAASSVEAANSTTARCVRNFLLENHKGTKYVSQAMKDKAASLLKNVFNNPCKYYPVSPFAPPLQVCTSQYNYQVNELLTDTIYHMHEDAYKSCCCPGSPAAEWSWVMIMTSNFEPTSLGLSSCWMVGKAVEMFGPCGCQEW